MQSKRVRLKRSGHRQPNLFFRPFTVTLNIERTVFFLWAELVLKLDCSRSLKFTPSFVSFSQSPPPFFFMTQCHSVNANVALASFSFLFSPRFSKGDSPVFLIEVALSHRRCVFLLVLSISVVGVTEKKQRNTLLGICKYKNIVPTYVTPK